MKQWPTAACRWYFALRGLSCRQSYHLSTPSHPWDPPGWPYCRQAQCGSWFTVQWSIADLLTSSHAQMSASHLLGLQGPQQSPAILFYRPYFNTLNSKIVYFGVHQVYQGRRATLTKIGLMINSYSSGFRQARITSKGMDEWKSPIHDSELFRLFKTFFDGLEVEKHVQGLLS